MALSDETIAEIGKAYGLGCKVADAGYPCDMLWFDGNPTPFARAIEAEVRKEDTELIRQMPEALEAMRSEAEVRKEDTELIRQMLEALESQLEDEQREGPIQYLMQTIAAARARLDGKP